MPRFLKNKWLWIGVIVLALGLVGFNVMQAGAAKKKAEEEQAATRKVESPYAAIANGKVDVEGGIIQIAARRGLPIEDVAPAAMLRARREAEALATGAAREGTA